jgi:hypothetical protein
MLLLDNAERADYARRQQQAQYASELRRQTNQQLGGNPRSHPRTSVHPVLADFQPTSVDQLNFPPIPYSLAHVPSMSQPHGLAGGADLPRFPSRLQALGGEIDAQQSDIANIRGFLSGFDQNSAQIDSGVHRLQESVRRMTATTIPQGAHRVTQLVKQRRQDVESASADIASRLIDSRDRFTEHVAAKRAFEQKFGDFSNISRSLFTMLGNEQNRLRGQVDATIRRIGTAEARQSAMESESVTHSENVDDADRRLVCMRLSCPFSGNFCKTHCDSRFGCDF